ncbi:hypothetical protein ALC57_00579 [Trachymyrmex cornetzi]|uniref:Uncharacterized protein n=1 Tax=Trachymyrmex cornetzi TaxID=471704 RepID=A0A151JRF9_9HYME|nr:hypothetical protein ALC57_00579 [Trachymyrmex cornetzi]
MTETFFWGEEEEPKRKRKRPSALHDNPIQASTPVKSTLNRSKTVPSTLNEMSEIIQPRELSYDHTPSVEEIFEVADEPLVTSIRHLLQTSESQEKLQTNYGPFRTEIYKSGPERHLMVFLGKEVESEERIHMAKTCFETTNDSTKNKDKKKAKSYRDQDIVTAAGLLTMKETSPPKCLFCEERYDSLHCGKARSISRYSRPVLTQVL